MAARKAARNMDPQRVRMILLGLGFLLAWAGLGYRLFQVQIVQAADFADQSLDQRLTSIETPPDRGTIFDRNGDPLAITIEAQSIIADPRLVENEVFTAQQVAAVSGGDWERMLSEIEKGGSFRYLIRQLEPAQAQAVLDLGLPGVSAIAEPKRVFPHGPIAAHVVGMVNIDGIGIEGLEAYYDDALSGTGGEVIFEKPLKSAGPDAPIAIPQAEIMTIPAIPGDDLVSTIDLSLQNSAYEACADTVERTGAEACWIVALEVETGEVLAMVGFPGFDPEKRVGLDGEPFSNFAIRGMYEPGSTQKLVTFAAGLDTGVFGTGTVIGAVADRIEITPGACDSDTDDINGCYGDFSPHETRDMTVKEIFTISSNVGTIRAQQMLGDG
ncbi:MAG: penicillin-binding transpeptidase domain-containing protein, partial [Acidimicrobiia bacterium]|nr:penicillin-binding transpeptidase domain-containing protein [Acidimicrobiia bacterium]